jgi:hypothetical protein
MVQTAKTTNKINRFKQEEKEGVAEMRERTGLKIT